MPSMTFLNLSKEKQNSIIKESLIEFADKPFSEVSINKIVKNAKISRGSFYTYFEDKYDLLTYLLELFRERMNNEIVKISKDVNGDLKKIIISIHKNIFDLYQENTHKKFLFNILVYFQTHYDEEVKKHREELPIFEDCQKIYEVVDYNQFGFNKDESKIKHTIDIAFLILKHTIFISAKKELEYKKSKTLLEEYLNILEHGYMKENNYA
ncbi:MAG: TetR/AcrR family transcriptional regulator [Candidatus Izemoplasmatales bacterium]